jgi:hypothetical protein
MSISRQDKQEFKGFCRNATDSQLHNIYLKEKTAYEEQDDLDRLEYADIAQDELERRNLLS